MKKVKYSFIVPVYNAEKYIERCIKSLCNQDYSDFEILIVNDGSTDKSLDICLKMASYDNRIVIINQKNKGVSSARNNGIAHAKGKYITFIDSDDYLEHNTLKIIDNIINNTNADLIKYSYFKDYNSKLIKYKFSVTTDKLISKENYDTQIVPYILNTFDFSSIWNCFINTKIIKKTKFSKNLKYAEDLKFMCELLNKSSNIYFCEKNLYHYVYNPTSAINHINGDKNIKILNDNIKVVNEISELFNLKNKFVNSRKEFILTDYFMNYNFLTYKKYKTELLKLKINNNISQLDYDLFASYKYYYKSLIKKIKKKIKIFCIKRWPSYE